MYRIIGGDQHEYGPVSAEQIREWVMQGRVNGQTLVLAEKSQEWKALANVPELAMAISWLSDPAHASGVKEPSSYMFPSILVTFCCCPPFGIVAILFSAGVYSKMSHGDLEGAKRSSRNAKLWCLISLISGIIAVIGLFILSALGFYGTQFLSF